MRSGGTLHATSEAEVGGAGKAPSALTGAGAGVAGHEMQE